MTFTPYVWGIRWKTVLIYVYFTQEYTPKIMHLKGLRPKYPSNRHLAAVGAAADAGKAEDGEEQVVIGETVPRCILPLYCIITVSLEEA